MTVRDLIGLWGARGRDATVVGFIEADLANHGLVTVPDFRAVTLEGDIAVELAAVGEVSPSTPVEEAGNPPKVEVSEAEPRRGRREHGLTVGNLPSADRRVESVSPSASFEQAVTKMLIFDYSQLAVMSGERKLHGAVTWRSIAKARHQDPAAPFSAAIVRAVEVNFDQDLIDILPMLVRDEFVFVRGPHQTISGIVTASDVVYSYGEMTSPFFVIGEIDQTLRWLLERSIEIGRILALCDPDARRGIADFAELTMGDYQRVLENPDAWADLGWPLDRKVFAERLKEICSIRNNITHFNGDPLPDDVLGMLKNFLTLLREYSDR